MPSSARVRFPKELEGLLRSELDEAITEPAFHQDDELIARRYLIDKWAPIDIAAELGWNRGSVGSHIKKIVDRVCSVANRLYPDTC